MGFQWKHVVFIFGFCQPMLENLQKDAKGWKNDPVQQFHVVLVVLVFLLLVAIVLFSHHIVVPCIPTLTRLLVNIRPNTSICPRLSAAIFVCAGNVVKNGVVCIMANFMFYTDTHSIGTCASLLHITIIIIIIKPVLKIFNECKICRGWEN